jgi:hypothetical protein
VVAERAARPAHLSTVHHLCAALTGAAHSHIPH